MEVTGWGVRLGGNGRLHSDTAAPPCFAASDEASPQCWGEIGSRKIPFSPKSTPFLPAPPPELGEAGRGLLRWRVGRFQRVWYHPHRTLPHWAGGGKMTPKAKDLLSIPIHRGGYPLWPLLLA